MSYEFGVGISTYNRERSLSICLEALTKFNDIGYKIFVHDDSDDPVQADCNAYHCENAIVVYEHNEAQGIAKAKNAALRHLKDCKDGVFLFDDDCAPRVPNWWEPFIKLRDNHSIHHSMYIDRFHQNDSRVPILEEEDFIVYNSCLGCMLYMSKEAIEVVGGFNEEMERYGYEHAEWGERYKRASLVNLGGHRFNATRTPYVTIPNVANTIFSADFVSAAGREGDPRYQSFVTNEHFDFSDYLYVHDRSLKQFTEEEIAEIATRNSHFYHTVNQRPVHYPL